jgi:acylphosphatase
LNRIVCGKEFNLFTQLRVTVFYSGRVQGVGFRYTVKRLVCGFDVSGAVQNLADGRVKLVAEGEKDELREFLLAVGDSGLGPMIRDEQVSWSEGTGEFRGFEIVR